jgi:curli biogenesis system outer membrane secretion channel CsgG
MIIINKNWYHLIILTLLISCTASNVQKVDTVKADYSETRLIGPKKRIYVANFENKSAYGDHRLGEGISDVLISELAKTNNFLLLERNNLKFLMEEQKLGQSGFINQNTAPELGRLMGANALIIGSITQFGVRTETHDVIITSGKKQVANCAVDIRLVDATTGEIVWAGSGKGEAERKYTNVLGSGKAGGYDETLEGEAFRAAIVKVMENLVKELNKLTWTCNIAKIEGNNIYVNAGQKSNLKINTILTVYHLGDPVIDPGTGIEIGRVEIPIGKAKVAAHFGEDGSILQLISGESIKIGDMCKLN